MVSIATITIPEETIQLVPGDRHVIEIGATNCFGRALNMAVAISSNDVL